MDTRLIKVVKYTNEGVYLICVRKWYLPQIWNLWIRNSSAKIIYLLWLIEYVGEHTVFLDSFYLSLSSALQQNTPKPDGIKEHMPIFAIFLFTRTKDDVAELFTYSLSENWKWSTTDTVGDLCCTNNVSSSDWQIRNQ